MREPNHLELAESDANEEAGDLDVALTRKPLPELELAPKEPVLLNFGPK